MDLAAALAEYQNAYEMDTSPLSKLNLADVFQYGGRLEEARLYAQDCLKQNDLSWMANYGIDPVRYKIDIHEILKKTYEGLARAEKYNQPANWREALTRPFRILNYRFQAEVQGHLYRKYSLLSARAYGTNDFSEIHLDSLTHFYNAFEPYTGRANDYLRHARNIEEPIIPESGPSYDLEEGRLLGNGNLVARALNGFDPVWELDQIAQSFIELAGMGRLPPEGKEELYAINPGALLQHGINLEVNLVISGIPAGTENVLRKAIKEAGIIAGSGSTGNAGNGIAGDGSAILRYTLTMSGLNTQEGIIVLELLDRDKVIKRNNISLLSLSSADRAAFSRALGQFIYNGF